MTYEITLLTFVGAVLGIWISYPFLKAVLSLNEPPLISFSYKINFFSYVLSILLTLGVSVQRHFSRSYFHWVKPMLFVGEFLVFSKQQVNLSQRLGRGFRSMSWPILTMGCRIGLFFKASIMG